MRAALTLLATLQLAACQGVPAAADAEALARLDWVLNADAARDASAAIAGGDYRLYRLTGRGQQIPGLDRDDAPALATRCGVRPLPGHTDMITSPGQRQRLAAAIAYAAAYNRRVATACRNR